MKHLLLADFDQ